MAVKQENVRIWITIHKDTKASIEKLMPLLKARSMGEVVELAITSYALAVIEYAAQQSKSSEERKEGKEDEKIN